MATTPCVAWCRSSRPNRPIDVRAAVTGLVGAFLSLFIQGMAIAEAVRWTVDPARSTIRLEVNALGMTQTGRFDDWNGDIVFDPANLEGARVNLAIQSSSLQMGDSISTAQAKSAGFLHVADFPRIDVTLIGLERVAADRYQARARVTCKGRTEQVVFPVDVRITGAEVRIDGTASLDREAFGIGTESLRGLVIGRLIKVDVDITARKRA